VICCFCGEPPLPISSEIIAVDIDAVLFVVVVVVVVFVAAAAAAAAAGVDVVTWEEKEEDRRAGANLIPVPVVESVVVEVAVVAGEGDVAVCEHPALSAGMGRKE